MNTEKSPVLIILGIMFICVLGFGMFWLFGGLLYTTYPSEEWCAKLSNTQDAIPISTPSFCIFNYTENKWHLNRTRLNEWQFKEKLGVDRK